MRGKCPWHLRHRVRLTCTTGGEGVGVVLLGEVLEGIDWLASDGVTLGRMGGVRY